VWKKDGIAKTKQNKKGERETKTAKQKMVGNYNVDLNRSLKF
jgi:hypothetical protein